jgi:hypothetical protein
MSPLYRQLPVLRQHRDACRAGRRGKLLLADNLKLEVAGKAGGRLQRWALSEISVWSFADFLAQVARWSSFFAAWWLRE